MGSLYSTRTQAVRSPFFWEDTELTKTWAPPAVAPTVLQSPAASAASPTSGTANTTATIMNSPFFIGDRDTLISTPHTLWAKNPFLSTQSRVCESPKHFALYSPHKQC